MSDIEIEIDLESDLEVEIDFPDLIFTSGGGGNVDIIDDITSTIIASISAPGTYHVLQFSGIDGGIANTIFTNSIIPS